MKTLLTVYFVLVAVCITRADTEWPPVHTDGKQVSLNWSVTDGGGYQWDITAYGSVNDGTNDAYDGGMILHVNGNQFMASQGKGTLLKSGREIMIGPWKHENTLVVHRLIYIDQDTGYCRWIDLFRNRGSEAASVKLRYYSNLGSSIQNSLSTTGGNNAGNRDWGLLTSSGSSSRPSIIHFWGTEKSRIRPDIKAQGDDIYYNFTLEIKPGEPAALCFFEMQRKDYSLAAEEFKTFHIKREIRKINPEIRRMIVNMPSVFITLAGVDLLRNEDHCLLGLRDGTEKQGTIRREAYSLETRYGPVTLKSETVVGLYTPTPGKRHTLIALSDGQVISGKLSGESLTIVSKDGEHSNIPLRNLLFASYPVSDNKPEQVAIKAPVIDLRSGSSLAFDPGSVDYTFLTEYGRCKLPPAHLEKIDLAPDEGGLHTVTFKNGSRLSGLLITEQIETDIAVGGALNVRRQSVKAFRFPAGESPASAGGGPVTVTLRNNDRLAGTILDDTLLLNVNDEDRQLPWSLVRAITRKDIMSTSVTVKLQAGETLVGKIRNKSLRFQVTPDLALPIYAGHIQVLDNPPAEPAAPPEKKSTETQPAKKAPAKPVAETAVGLDPVPPAEKSAAPAAPGNQ